MLGSIAQRSQLGRLATSLSKGRGPRVLVRPLSTKLEGEGNGDFKDRSMIQMQEKELIHDIHTRQIQSASDVVPWFLKNMPNSYFRQISNDLQRQHVAVIASLNELEDSALTIKINKKNEDGSVDTTYLTKRAPNDASVGSNTSPLFQQIAALSVPYGTKLHRMQIFSAEDMSVDLNIFSFRKDDGSARPIPTKEDTMHIDNYIRDIKAGKVESDVVYDEAMHGDAAMQEYYKNCSSIYCKLSNPRRFLNQKALYEQVKGEDKTKVTVEDTRSMVSGELKGRWITIASANIYPQRLLRLTSKILSLKDINVMRCHLNTVSDNSGGGESYNQVTMLRILIEENEALMNEPGAYDELTGLLKRSKWLDDEVIGMGLDRHPELGVVKAEIINAFCSMLHVSLAKTDPQSFASTKSINAFISSSPHFLQIADDIAQLFIERFRPEYLGQGGPLSDADFDTREADLKARISNLHYESAKVLLSKMVDVTRYTLKTNLYHPDRYSLAFRMDPRILVDPDSNKPMPFGFMFACSRNVQFFHNRFRDIARGGLRVVTPPNAEQHALESSRIFSECYGLSWAQQLKNKDIPEGGSKAVCLVNSPNIPKPNLYLETRKAVRACTDAILDLTVEDSVQQMVDYYGKPELIYLGPDEQVQPSDCDWICERAGQRGYAVPMAFMSSKPNAGINHKVYGVTSEGVVVYLQSALRNLLGIDPATQPFTIKITGGPDGDVGGNLLKILFNKYPDTCKVLGIADGSGVAEDPTGLNGPELIRLFEAGSPIADFDKSKLSKEGVVLSAENEEGLARRNDMVFRIKSDAFIPAGGRPNTININNWKEFLCEDGKTPTSPLIVEGANIFTTPEARQALFEHAGVAIVKDSSANKCGVITSSMEVAASMLLTTDEFLSVKKPLVEDVIKKLHHVAEMEAELLFREYRNFPGALPHFSERISNAINFVTDRIVEKLATDDPDMVIHKRLVPVMREYFPMKLQELAWDRVESTIPESYQRSAIAAILASNLVYKEGIHIVESQPADRIAERAIAYYDKSKEVDVLLEELFAAQKTGELSEEKQKQVIDMLKKGGARTSCDFF